MKAHVETTRLHARWQAESSDQDSTGPQHYQTQNYSSNDAQDATLLDFPPNTTHEMCCNLPYLVAIAAIATNLCRKKTQLNVSLHQPVATHVFFMFHQFFYCNIMRRCNQHLRARSCWLQIIILRRICCCHRCNCIVRNTLQFVKSCVAKYCIATLQFWLLQGGAPLLPRKCFGCNMWFPLLPRS